MVQIKKDAVRKRILKSAAEHFQKRGYNSASISQIAATAKTAPATLYVYYPSKIDLAFAVFEPWIKERFQSVRKEVLAAESGRAQLHCCLKAIWQDIPNAQNNFFNSFIQAIASSSLDGGYKPSVLNFMKEEIIDVLEMVSTDQAIKRLNNHALAALIVMAFDGFVINAGLPASDDQTEKIIDQVIDLIMVSNAA